MPDAAEVLALVLELLHLDDLGKALDALHERVLDRPSHVPRELHELRWRERLVVEEDHLVLEEGAPDRRDGLTRKLRQINAEDLGAQRAGDAADLQFHSSLMFAALMIAA